MIQKLMTDDIAPDRLTPQTIRQLKQRSIKSWLLVSMFQLLAIASHPVRQWVGRFLGFISRVFIRRRRKIVEQNLALCFPEKSVSQRQHLLTLHFRALAQSVVDRGVLWFGTPAQIRALVHVKGRHHADEALSQNGRLMLLAPHFVGLDAAASRLTLDGPRGATLYSAQSDPDVDALVRLGRGRFHEVNLIHRRGGVRTLLREIEQGTPIYYLPDMDFGMRGAMFAPFFGIMAATQTAPAQLAQQFNMTVLPVLCFWNPKTGYYTAEFLSPLVDFPGQDDIATATARLNALLENWVRLHPEQYYWVHRRFKTRPKGEKSPYTP
jgi:KDO2-lipid IV(A) lauroyltransferase